MNSGAGTAPPNPPDQEMGTADRLPDPSSYSLLRRHGLRCHPAGLVAPRLARCWGAGKIATASAAVALASGAILPGLAGQSQPARLFVGDRRLAVRYGLVNPLDTAITLQSFFGRAQGLASARLGLLQMFCAAIGTAPATSLTPEPVAGLGLFWSAARPCRRRHFRSGA